MKYVDEFRDEKLAKNAVRAIEEAARGRGLYRIMEVCGTHTMSIHRYGIKRMLPESIELTSGPGCPVCVTPTDFIDAAIEIAAIEGVTVATFGDMLKVPGTGSSLEQERMAGRDVRVMYSTLDALDYAVRNPGKEVVFLGIGFETTAPTVASAIIESRKRKIKNFSVLCGHKTMPRALRVLAEDRHTRIDGFILPAHVSAIIGQSPYLFLANEFGKNCVIAGFEPLDILQGILALLEQKKPKVEIQYDRVVRRAGNRKAQKVIDAVFEQSPSNWRGIGMIDASGLSIRSKYASFDAERRFKITRKISKKRTGCICGAILKGIKIPPDCALYRKRCTPQAPVGPCMVSSEGACSAYYKYT
ncbi:MAG: hydrogenase formation protein HypD [Candidatus Omnitrophota bacterium]